MTLALTDFDAIPKDTALCMYMVFANTAWGKKLETRPRYAGMVPASWSVEQWERLLGPDANNLHHMYQSIINAAHFVANENRAAIERGQTQIFTFEDAIILCTAGAIHDQAETILGDIAYGLKSLAMRKEEEKLLVIHEMDFAPHLITDNSQSEQPLDGISLKRANLYRRAREVAFGDVTELLPGAFEAIEKVGFLNNYVRALKLYTGLDDRCMSNEQLRLELGLHDSMDCQSAVIALRRVIIEFLGSGVLEGLIRLAKRFESLNETLREHAETISSGMNSMSDDDFLWYTSDERITAVKRQDEPQRRKNKLVDQRDKWRRYTEDHIK